MLTITVPGDEFYDEEAEKFVTQGDVQVPLEHSLVSLSKWESIFEKPFLTKEAKTTEETLTYIKCMSLDPDIAPEVFQKLSQENFEQITNYIEAKSTATWLREIPGSSQSSEVITSELIYYWLVAFNIPFEVETWHLNRLLILIKICGLKNSKPKKMSPSEIAARNRELNAQRRKQLGTSG